MTGCEACLKRQDPEYRVYSIGKIREIKDKAVAHVALFQSSLCRVEFPGLDHFYLGGNAVLMGKRHHFAGGGDTPDQ